jgi:hypothetical protein
MGFEWSDAIKEECEKISLKDWIAFSLDRKTLIAHGRSAVALCQEVRCVVGANFFVSKNPKSFEPTISLASGGGLVKDRFFICLIYWPSTLSR